jgi:hypothetical protein
LLGSDSFLRTLRHQTLLETACGVARRELGSAGGRVARQRLLDLGIGTEAAARFELGWSPTWAHLESELAAAGFQPTEIEASGLIDLSWTDSWVGPWRNERGRLLSIFSCPMSSCGLVCRATRSPICLPLFGLNWATEADRRTKHLVLVEDVMDALLMQSAGFRCVVGIGGTGHLMTTQRWSHLARLRIEQVTLVPSSTEPSLVGTVAALRNGDSVGDVPQRFTAGPIMTSFGHTPGDLVRRKGVTALWDLLASRIEAELFMSMFAPVEWDVRVEESQLW